MIQGASQSCLTNRADNQLHYLTHALYGTPRTKSRKPPHPPTPPKKTHSFSGHLQQGVWRWGCISMKPPTRLCVTASQSGTQHWSETQGNPTGQAGLLRSCWDLLLRRFENWPLEQLHDMRESSLWIQSRVPSPWQPQDSKAVPSEGAGEKTVKFFCNAHCFATWGTHWLDSKCPQRSSSEVATQIHRRRIPWWGILLPTLLVKAKKWNNLNVDQYRKG